MRSVPDLDSRKENDKIKIKKKKESMGNGCNSIGAMNSAFKVWSKIWWLGKPILWVSNVLYQFDPSSFLLGHDLV